MQEQIKKILNKATLSSEEAYNSLLEIAKVEVPDEQIVAFMIALQSRPIAVEEVHGFQKALLELAIPVELDGSNAIDLCGTGGDGKNTFNVSTTTAFVLASMGYKVIKHGNYGVSSLCGSSNVLNELGVEFTNDSKRLNEQLNENNVCFLHAPLFHPVMKKVAPLRKNLGIPTFFNIMGPLVNPVQPAFQLTGVFSMGVARVYQHTLRKSRKNYGVIYGLDGYDEITLTGDARVFSKHSDEIINAERLGIERIDPKAIHGGRNPKEAAEILKSILSGKGTIPQHQVVAINCAKAINLMDSTPLEEAFKESIEHIKSGRAIQILNQLTTENSLA
mgnify:CR=1 FL=1|tara:strand:+ start:165099 stop:166097 length:999 start_codon:yes stop_codon:yes gene_type:complete